MTTEVPPKLPVLLIDDSPGQELGSAFPRVTSDDLGPGIAGDPNELIDLRWIASSQQALAYRRFLWEEGTDLSGAFVPMVLIADYDFSQPGQWESARLQEPNAVAALRPYAECHDPLRLERIMRDELVALASIRRDAVQRTQMYAGQRTGQTDAAGCFAAGLILNDLRGWPIAEITRTRSRAVDMAGLGLDIFETHVRLGLHEHFHATDGNIATDWPQILSRACRILRDRITVGLKSGMIEIGRADLLRLCVDKGRGSVAHLGAISLAGRFGTRRVGVRSLFLDCSDDVVADRARDWAQDLHKQHRPLSSSDRDWTIEIQASLAVERLWSYRLQYWPRVQARLAMAYGLPPDTQTLRDLGLSDRQDISRDMACDVRQFIDGLPKAERDQLLRLIVLLTIVKLLGLRFQALTTNGRGLGNGDAGADLQPNDVYFALAPLWAGVPMPAGGAWDGVKNVLDKSGLVTLVNALLQEKRKGPNEGMHLLKPEERWIMRSYAIDPVRITKAWWGVDPQARRILGAP